MKSQKKKMKRKLSEAEQKRLQHYEELSAEKEKEGYRRTELTIDILAANIFALLLGIPLAFGGGLLFFMFHPDYEPGGSTVRGTAVFFVLILVLVVVHELIHGLTWSFFTGSGWKNIEFGIMMESLTPYCTCTCPLSRGAYITGALMPLAVLGLIPMAAGILTGSAGCLLMGIIMSMAAGGDIMIVLNMLRYKSGAGEVFYMDHPTEAGGVIFER